MRCLSLRPCLWAEEGVGYEELDGWQQVTRKPGRLGRKDWSGFRRRPERCMRQVMKGEWSNGCIKRQKELVSGEWVRAGGIPAPIRQVVAIVSVRPSRTS